MQPKNHPVIKLLAGNGTNGIAHVYDAIRHPKNRNAFFVLMRTVEDENRAVLVNIKTGNIAPREFYKTISTYSKTPVLQ